MQAVSWSARPTLGQTCGLTVCIRIAVRVRAEMRMRKHVEKMDLLAGIQECEVKDVLLERWTKSSAAGPYLPIIIKPME